MKTSARNLKFMAGTFWYGGSAVLVLKGSQMLSEAEKLQAGQVWPWLAIAVSGLLGSLKAKFIFHKFCRMNLARIEALAHPRPWHFFQPLFFTLLFLMISVGVALSYLARNHYSALIGVAILDLTIAVALLCSSSPYWKRGASSRS